MEHSAPPPDSPFVLLGHRVLRAGIFDMDGVLLDSEPLHHQAVNQLLADEAHDALSFEDYAPYMGTTDEYTWNDLIRRFALQRPLSFYRERYDAAILELYRHHSEITAGARSLLEALRGLDLRLAIASSSRRDWVETCLRALGIREAFDVVVTGDAVSRSKPDPEIYLLAAERLSVPARECFAIEDSPNGAAAAVAAGMVTIVIETPYTRGLEVAAADIRLRSLADLDCRLLSHLFPAPRPQDGAHFSEK